MVVFGALKVVHNLKRTEYSSLDNSNHALKVYDGDGHDIVAYVA